MADSDDERDIMQCDDRRFKAMVRGDLATLRMALADDLTYTHSSGQHETKAQFLASLTMGQLSYKSIIPEARSVHVYGGAGIVTGTAHGDRGARSRRPLSYPLHCGVRQGAGSLAAGGVAVHACARRIGGVHGRLWPSSPAPDSTRPPVVREAGGPGTIGRAVSATHTLPRGIAAPQRC